MIISKQANDEKRSRRSMAYVLPRIILIIIKMVPTKPSRWWPSGKNSGPRGLLSLWSQVRALWLLIWWPLEAYMVVNFRIRGISRGACKLARIPTLKKKKNLKSYCWYIIHCENYIWFFLILWRYPHRFNSWDPLT